MDCEMPQAFNQERRTARKQHSCCECHQPINVGTEYEHCSGIWDGTPDSFKTCLSCVEIREDYVAETGEMIAFKELGSSIQELFYKSFGPKEYAENSGIELERIMRLMPEFYDEKSA